ncbi:MAG TPA: pyridoxamine 5'-phosphate oxidase family protein [Sphingomicrobium sp.]|jgi:nitroimidazol reductase NimA-like FMN-containing flavoprotein (pyridoxamine 5'-phosphate oxidase superfamily)|nr:pyridoxamine 5'-phosphate oxidase family protein [Sphingomicrobium sp.]
MKEKAIQILDQNRLMAIATVRPDGWPQATMVGYANDDLLLYFVISRASQKFANIEQDGRVSIVVGRDFHDPATIKALSIAARADEVRDPKQRDHAIALLLGRHPGLQRLERPSPDHSAVMRANPEIVTILDYEKGFGHSDLLTIGPGGLAEMTAARDDDWGFGTRLKPTD